MATYTLDWSETNLGGSAVVSYGSGAVLDFTDKPAGATSALSITANQSDSSNVTIAEFSIETSGSSVLTFDYHTSTESGFDKLHIDVDGVSQANYSGEVAWTSHAGISIPSAGVHTIRFRYQKDAGGLLGQDRVWVALLNITNTVTTNDASGTLTTYDMEDGAIPSVVTTSTWTNSTSEPIAGTRSLRSPAAPAASGSYDLTVTKPAGSGYRAVGFDWKVSSEASFDKLYLFPDSSAANVPASGHPGGGSPGWIAQSGTASGRFAVILPAASSSFLLRYAKDGGGNVGSDAAWIDGLKMPSTGAATVASVVATATAAAPIPTVVGTTPNATVTSVAATATATALAPVVSASVGASLRQSASGSAGVGGSVSASFPSTPIVGNLLHAVVCDRSGASTSVLSGSGWTLREEEVVAPADGTYRFYMAIWEKVAGASEPTTVTATVTDNCAIVLCEWQAGSEAFNFVTSTSANTFNAGTITSQATGTTGPVTGTQACFAFCGIKSGPTASPPWTAWTNSFTNEVAFDAGAGAIDISVSLRNTNATGSKTTTASGNGTDRSTAGAIIVYTLGAPPPDAIVTAPTAIVTATALPPVVDGGAPATVNAVKATATAGFIKPVVTGETLLQGGGAATATAQAIAPAISGNGGTPANVIAVKATATGSASAPVVEGATVLEGGGAASATAQMLAPVVLGNGGIAVNGVRAIVTATAQAPVITGNFDATVTGVLAIANARVITPTVSVVEPTFFFSPPTHEEPIRTREKPLVYFRLTYAQSVVRLNGGFVQIRTPMPEVLEGLVEGVDFFRGGYEYEITRDTALELEAAGYTTTQIV